MRIWILIICAITLVAACKRVPKKGELAAQQVDSTLVVAKRVTGIGGIFFKSKNPAEMKLWYAKHLGLNTNEYGSLFETRDTDNPDQIQYLQWSVFNDKTKYFEPSEKEFMINYRVVQIEVLVDMLRAEGVTILDTIETYDYGKFVHIMDPEGNKIELWEPVDSVFTRTEAGKTTH